MTGVNCGDSVARAGVRVERQLGSELNQRRPFGGARLAAASVARRASIAPIAARRTSVTPVRVAVESMSGLARFAPRSISAARSSHRALQPFGLLLERLPVDRVELRQHNNLCLSASPPP